MSCLVQAARKDRSVGAVIDALEFLGKVGIRLDKETNEYFTIPEVKIDRSKESKHYHEKLLPHKERVRSLMDIDMPEQYQSTFDIENRYLMNYNPVSNPHLNPIFNSVFSPNLNINPKLMLIPALSLTLTPNSKQVLSFRRRSTVDSRALLRVRV